LSLFCTYKKKVSLVLPAIQPTPEG